MRKQGPAHLRRNLRTTRTAAAGGRGQKRQHSPAAPKPAGAQGETTHKAKGPCARKSITLPRRKPPAPPPLTGPASWPGSLLPRLVLASPMSLPGVGWG